MHSYILVICNWAFKWMLLSCRHLRINMLHACNLIQIFTMKNILWVQEAPLETFKRLCGMFTKLTNVKAMDSHKEETHVSCSKTSSKVLSWIQWGTRQSYSLTVESAALLNTLIRQPNSSDGEKSQSGPWKELITNFKMEESMFYQARLSEVPSITILEGLSQISLIQRSHIKLPQLQNLKTKTKL